MFEQSFVSEGGTHRRWTVSLAILGELLVLGILVAIPLMYVQVLPAPELMNQVLLAPPPLPPPPPPPPPASARIKASKIVPRKFELPKLVAQAAVPKQVTIPSEPSALLPEAPEIAGIPGGMAGGIPGGALGSILNPVLAAPPPLPPLKAVTPTEPAPPSRIRVGGNVQAGLLLHEVKPAFPKLAAEAHIIGRVRLKAVIGCDGKVENLTLISGHPLLIPAAEAAVKQWIYKPTLLNGLPVEVDTEIDVNFVAS